MTATACPHCGAEKREDGLPNYYRCWTRVDGSRRDSDCYEREIAQKDEKLDVLNTIAAQAAEIERLKEEVKHLDDYAQHREWCRRSICDNDNVICSCGLDAARGEVK